MAHPDPADRPPGPVSPAAIVSKRLAAKGVGGKWNEGIHRSIVRSVVSAQRRGGNILRAREDQDRLAIRFFSQSVLESASVSPSRRSHVRIIPHT